MPITRNATAEAVERAVPVVNGRRCLARGEIEPDGREARVADGRVAAAAELADLVGERRDVRLGLGRLSLLLPGGALRDEPLDLAGRRVDLVLDVLDRDVLADDRPERREAIDGLLNVLLRDAQDEVRVAGALLGIDVERRGIAAERARDRDRLLRALGDGLAVLTRSERVMVTRWTRVEVAGIALSDAAGAFAKRGGALHARRHRAPGRHRPGS